MGRRRRYPAGQALLVIGGWTLFAWSWIKVGSETSSRTVLWSLVALFVISLVVIAVTLWWIAHNVLIYRKKGPRRSVPMVFSDYGNDFLERQLNGDWSWLRRSDVVVIRVDEGRKLYDSLPPTPLRGTGL